MGRSILPFGRCYLADVGLQAALVDTALLLSASHCARVSNNMPMRVSIGTDKEPIERTRERRKRRWCLCLCQLVSGCYQNNMHRIDMTAATAAHRKKMQHSHHTRWVYV